MNNVKKMIAVLLCLTLTLSLTACRKKAPEPAAKPTPAVNSSTIAIPTPEPPSVDTLLDISKAEIKRLSELSKGTTSIPDGKCSIISDIAFNLNLLDFIQLENKSTIKATFEAVSDIVKGSASISSTVSDPSSSDSPSSETTTEKYEIYLDNTTKEAPVLYMKEKTGDWDKKTLSPTEDISSMIDSIEGYLPEDLPEENDSGITSAFKDFETFLKDHSSVSSTTDGFALTTSFTWNEFYSHYSDAFALIARELGSLGDSLFSLSETEEESDISGADVFVNWANTFFASGTGAFTLTTTFDYDKKIKKIACNILDFSLSADISFDETTAPVKIAITKASITAAISKPGSSMIIIPKEALEAEEYDPKALPDISTIPDLESLDDTDTTSVSKSDGDDVPYASESNTVLGDAPVDEYWDPYLPDHTTDYAILQPGSYTEEEGIYYIPLGKSFSLPIMLGEGHMLVSNDHNKLSISLSPEILVTYSNPLVTLDNATLILSEYQSLRDYYKGKADVTLTQQSVEGLTQPVYVIAYSLKDYNKAMLYIGGSQGAYFLKADVTYTTDNISLDDIVTLCTPIW